MDKSPRAVGEPCYPDPTRLQRLCKDSWPIKRPLPLNGHPPSRPTIH
jgi:hypothetical protein